MAIKYYFTKRKILSLVILSCLICFCSFIAIYNLYHIPDTPNVLDGGNIEAMFYVENPESGSITCIGDGIINTKENISGDSTLVASKIISAPDNSANWGGDLVVNWNSIRFASNQYQVFGTLGASTGNNAVAIVSNIEELKNSNVSAGDIISTRGFYAANDNGAAKYIITSSPGYPLETNISIGLRNGLYANLLFDSTSTINVACFGIQPNAIISQHLSLLSKTLNHKIQGFQFNDGTYYFDTRVYLTSLNYLGSKKTSFYVTNFATDFFGVFTTSSTEPNVNIALKNIDFYFTPTKESVRFSRETCLVYLQNIANCTVDGCKFISSNLANSTFSPTDLFWVKSDSLNSLNITNSQFINSSGESHANNKDHLVGGCIWVSGINKNGTGTFKNIDISNCVFSTTVTDEAIAIWNGKFGKMEINTCKFDYIGNVINDNIIALYNGLFSNAILYNNEFNIKGKSTRLIKFMNLQDNSALTVNKNKFNIDNKNTDFTKAYELILFLNDSISNTSLNVTGNELKGASDASYETFVTIKNVANKVVNITNNTNHLNLTTGFTRITASTNTTINATKNHIYNVRRLNTIADCTSLEYNYDGNTIDSPMTNYIASHCDMTYSFTNNNVEYTNSAIIQCYDVTSSSSIDLEFENNSVHKDDLKLFYSNNSITEKHILSNN